MIVTGQSASFEAIYDSGITGLVGSVEVAINDNEGNTVFGPTGAGISEISIVGNPTGVYTKEFTAPASPGQYTLVWSKDGTFDPISVSTEDLLVSLSAALPPFVPAPPGVTADTGPCSLWLTVDDIAESGCCDLSSLGTDLSSLEEYAGSASQMFWELTGRRYSGSCGMIARPCNDGCSCWPFQRLAYPAGSSVESRYIYTGMGVGWTNGYDSCGCGCLPRVLLSGIPIQEIVQVKIDGEILDPSVYRLDEDRYLVRRDGGFWPACQNRALDDDQPGTFSVSYIYGEGPPLAGRRAAIALACELFNACSTGDCALPKNTVRLVRQGLTIENVRPVAELLQAGATGIFAIDSFLAIYKAKPYPAVWSPDGPQYARPVGS